MTFGSVIIFLATGASVFSAWSFLLSASTGSDEHRRRGRAAFLVMTGALTVASALLFAAFLQHRFEYEYVVRYSSRDLPLGYLISSFWAGQEGTFLLWALLTAVFGVVYYKTSKQFENAGMVVVTVVEIFFLLLLIKKSPFALTAVVPEDGSGLNPLLQNPWMVIHPPILFIGYAAMTFPFAVAIAALVRREYGSWIRFALPWSLVTSIMLGAGIVIGGFWAYETLGWGGYWGWDPVENSSFIPWLTILALTHGLIIQRMTGALQRTNFFLALVSFLLVVYATFLTRSGVLADFSVHSFQDLGINTYLIVFLIVSVIAGAGLFVLRFRSIPSAPMEHRMLNRQNALFISMMVLCASGLVVFAGTSLPIVSRLFGAASQVDISFYNAIHIPIGIAVALMLSITPWLFWKEEGWKSILRRLPVPFILAGLITLGGVLAGMRGFGVILFFWSAVFAFGTNLLVVVRQWKQGWFLIGAPLSHVGVAMMLAGIVISGNFSRTGRAILQPGTPADLEGYRVSYLRSGLNERGREEIILQCTSPGGTSFEMRPLLYFNAVTNSMMREPSIKTFPFHDIYVSALEKNEEQGMPLDLQKDMPKEFMGATLTFRGFQTEHRQETGEITVRTRIEVLQNGVRQVIEPALEVRGNSRTLSPAVLSVNGAQWTVVLNDIHVSSGGISILFRGSGEEQVVVELSVKPFMNILWIGTIIMVAGLAIALRRRLTEYFVSQ